MTKQPESTPAAPDPKSRSKSGYAEPQPRDGNAARQPDPRQPPDPDDGGLGRKPVEGPDATDA